MAKPIVGIDLGGTNMQIGVVSDEGKLLGEARRKTKADEGFDAVIGRVTDGVREACETARIKPSGLLAVGLAAPGPIDPTAGVVLEAVNLRWNDAKLGAVVTRALGVPCIVDNDVNAAVYGEYKLGAGRGVKDLLGVWLGTGVGGGLILNGRLYYGANLTAGEIGHMVMFPHHPPGNRSVEHNCSRSAVVDRLVRLVNANRKSMLPQIIDGPLTDMKSKSVGKAFRAGDELTIEVIEDVAANLGSQIGSIVTLLSLPRIVLGGGLTEALGKPFVDMVHKHVRRVAFPERAKKVDVVASALEDNAGVYGAAMIAQERMENGK